MAKWFIFAALLIVVFFFGGLALIALSGHGGSRTGGSPIVWHVGGLMLYASIICAPICFIAGTVALAVEGVVARIAPTVDADHQIVAPPAGSHATARPSLACRRALPDHDSKS